MIVTSVLSLRPDFKNVGTLIVMNSYIHPNGDDIRTWVSSKLVWKEKVKYSYIITCFVDVV